MEHPIVLDEEQAKYEDRISLMKQIHEEEMAQLRRVNKERESHLESRIIEFERTKAEIFEKAKNEAQ